MQWGVSYYPELIDPSEWATDLDRMAEMDLKTIRMLDFAWSALEPREGQHTLDWCDRFLDMLQERGMKAVLCTPTAAPPPWLTEQYPEMMVVLRNGQRLSYGERRAACVNNGVYRQHSIEIAQTMARQWGKHPAVIGWQIDNELIGPEFREFFECHCDACVFRFRQWLKARYPSVEAINDAWGLKFWSMAFSAWGEIPTPKCRRAVMGHTLDFHRFYSDSTVDYLRLQYDALRANIDKRQWVSHNSTGLFDRGIDHRAMARELDVAGWDAYRGAAAAGHDHIDAFNGLAHDWFRSSLGKPFWLFETGASEGFSTSFMAEMRARGALGVMFWHWRAHRANLEQTARAICDHDGQPVPQRVEAIRAAQKRLAGQPALPATLSAKSAAIVFDPDNVRAQHRDSRRPMPYLDAVGQMQEPLWRHGVMMDVVHPGEALEAFKFVALPGLRLMKREDAARFAAFVKAGGVLLATGRTAHQDQHGVYYRRAGEPMLAVLGLSIRDARVGKPQTVRTADGQRFTDVVECEELTLEGAEALAWFEGGTLDGKPAAVKHRHGKGQVFYAGGHSRNFNEWLAQQAVKAAKLDWHEQPHAEACVIDHLTQKKRWLINHGDQAVEILGHTVPARDFVIVPRK